LGTFVFVGSGHVGVSMFDTYQTNPKTGHERFFIDIFSEILARVILRQLSQFNFNGKDCRWV
jgi:hypothetical protein